MILQSNEQVIIFIFLINNNEIRQVRQTEQLKNYMEELAEEVLTDYLSKKDNVCKCSRCKLDMKAFILNKVPPHYVVSDRGYLHWKLDEMRTQFNVDILSVVIEAVEKVNGNKRH